MVSANREIELNVDIQPDDKLASRLRQLADAAVQAQNRLTAASRQTTDAQIADVGRLGAAWSQATSQYVKQQNAAVEAVKQAQASAADAAIQQIQRQQQAWQAAGAAEAAARAKLTQASRQDAAQQSPQQQSPQQQDETARQVKEQLESLRDRIEQAQDLDAKFVETSKLVSDGMRQIARGMLLLSDSQSDVKRQALEMWVALEGGASVMEGLQGSIKRTSEAWKAYTQARKTASAAESAGKVISTAAGGPAGIAMAAGAVAIGAVMYAWNASAAAARKQAEALKASQDRIKAFGEQCSAAADHLKQLRDINYKARSESEDLEAHAGVSPEEGDVRAARKHAKQVQEALDENAQRQHDAEMKHERAVRAAEAKRQSEYEFASTLDSGDMRREGADNEYNETVGKADVDLATAQKKGASDRAELLREQQATTKQVENAQAASDKKKLNAIADEVRAAQKLAEAAHEAVKAAEEAVKAEQDKYKSAAEKFGELDPVKQRQVAEATKAVRAGHGTREQEQLVLDNGDEGSQQMVHARRAAKGEKDLRRTGIDKYHREGIEGAERNRDAAVLHGQSADSRRAKAEDDAYKAGFGNRITIHGDFEHAFTVKMETDAKDLSQRIADGVKPLIAEVARQQARIKKLEEDQRLKNAANKNNAKGLN